MAITPQRAYRIAASGTVKRFEDANKESPALRPGLAFNRGSTHRRCSVCWRVVSRRQNVSDLERGLWVASQKPRCARQMDV